MLSPISARVKLLQAKRREIRAKIHRTLIVALIAPLFVTISAPPSLGLPNTPSSTPTSPFKPSSPTQEVPSPFTSAASLKSSAPITQGANLNSTGLLVRFDAKTTASYSGSGTTWNDISGNGRSAAFTGKTSPLTTDYTDSGFTFKGIGFNGSSQFATINSNFSGAFNGLSISFYANLGAATSFERIVDVGDGRESKNFIIARSGTTQTLLLAIFNGATSQGFCQANSGIDNNTWAHWAFVVDGTNCQIYKNGTAFNSITNTTTNVTSTSGSVAYTGLPENTTRASALIGKSNWSTDPLFEGAIADLAIFNRALTSTEVVQWRDDQISNVNAGSGVCANRVANPAAVTVTSIGGDCILKFTAISNATTSNSWVVPAAINRAKVLTVAGGGGGGAWVGGGGGAGGFIEGFTSVSAATAISVSVGAGGGGASKVGGNATADGANGANSTFGSSFTAEGGGRGASWNYAAIAGGSGGGGSSEGSSYHAGAAATRPEQGYAGGSKSTVSSCNWDYGYPTGGGGGAGAIGGSATCVTNSTGRSGAGGSGRSSDITGTTTVYAGGGGGGIHGNATYQGIAGAGGSGGGGAGAAYNNGVARTCAAGSIVNVRGGDGTAGLGGGGGGSGAPSATGCNSTGGTGGSGVVVVRYGTSIQVAVKFTNTFAATEPSTFSPYMRFKASDYDATNKIWYDSSGNGRNTSSIRGTPQVVTTTLGNGSTKTFTTVQGGTTAGVQFKNKKMSTNGWTMFSVARYNGAQSGYSRLFDGETDNFIFGFYWGRSGVAHYNDGGWLPISTAVTPDSYGQNWVVSSGYTDTYRGNGYAGTATNPLVRISRDVGDAFPAMTINAGQQVGSEQSTWQVAETIIFDRKLDVSEIEKIEDYLATTYGIQNYVRQSAIADTVTVNASAGSVTLSSTYSATLGYQNTFSVSPSIPGITLESPAANQTRLRIASTVAPGTYWETITATDVMGNTAILPVRVEVVPALQWSVSNPSTFTTTFGKNSRLRLDLSGGFGTRTATVAHVSSPAPRGITLDTSSISSGFINFVVDTGTAIGTYTESITVTDGSGLVKTTILTLTINSPPDITYSTQTDAAFPYVTQNLLLNLDVANPNSYPGTGTTWTDTVGGRTFTLSNSPTYSQSSGGTLAFAAGKEAVSSTNWTNLETFTVETWFKLNSLSANIPCFVTSTYSSTHINFAICQWGTGTLVGGYHVSGVGWQGYVSVANVLTTNTWNHAVYSVSKSGSTYTGTLYLNGVAIGSATSSYAPQTQTGPLRIGKRWDLAEHIDGDIPVVRIYNASLTAQQIRQNFQNSKVRFVSATSVSPTSSGTTSLNATAGTARDFQLFTANDGVGNKTLSLSGVNSSFRIDTSTANTAIFKVLSSAASTNASTARTYSETLTAVDTNGISTAYYLTVTVNPAILITSTSDTITTTFGRTGSTTLNVAANTGTGSSTFSRVSGSGSSAITATFTSGQAVLSVAGTLPAGTYYETLTATDSLGATASKVVTIVVNAAMAIVPSTGSTTFETTFTRATTARLNVTGGTGNRTYAITYPSSASRWRITLDTSTAASNFVTVRADSFTATGTHSITVTVTDSLSATASTTLTLNVNEFPILNNVRNENTYTKPGLVLNLDAANPLSSTGAGNWKDLSGAGSSATFTSAPTYSSANGGIFTFNGSANYLTLPSITTATSPGVTSGVFPEYTAETWVRFSYPSFASFSGSACLICEAYAGTSGSMNMALSIRNNGQIHSGYLPTTPQGWVETVTAVGTVTTGIWYHIAATVVKSGNNYVNTIYLNGVAITSATSLLAPATSSRDYYIGRRWDSASQLLNGSVGVVRVYNRGLSQSEIQDNYNALVPRYVNTSARSSTFTTTQGASASSSSIPATLGTGNKTLTLAPVIAGITGDTSTANAIRVTSASTLAATDTQTARTYIETVTATDVAGASVTHLVNVVVNPPIILAANSTSIATTSGIETSTVITASRGSSTVTFTRTGTSNSGITLSAVGNQATLRVLSTINPGTYFETVTATDTASATTSMVFTIVVAPPPSITGVSRIETSKGALFVSPIYAVSGGTGTLTMTVTKSPLNSNIFLTGVTSAGAFLRVESVSETGTYTSTIRVTDARGAFAEMAVTVIVNAPVTLSGSLSIEKTYGNSTTNGYSTNGSGTAPFSFSATPVCAVVRQVSGNLVTEKINGTDSCTWTAPVGVSTVDAFLVGAGGGGGGDGGAGGGGGSINALGAVPLPANRQLTVQVGAGGNGGVWGGNSATTGGATSITTGSTTYSAPGGYGGAGCGSAATAGAPAGTGGTASAGGSGGFGGTGTGCGPGTGGAGSNGPFSNFLGLTNYYGGGGGGGPYGNGIAYVGGNAGGTGGGGTGAIARGIPSFGLLQYYRTQSSSPANATSKQAFSDNTCAVVYGNLNYTNDDEFPCSQKDNFQGYAEGFFIAPVSGSITFSMLSDDSSLFEITANSTANVLSRSSASTTYTEMTVNNFVAGQAYPIWGYFTEMGGGAAWVLRYAWSGQAAVPIPISQFRSSAEGLALYFKNSASTPADARTKPVFTTGTCTERVSNINFTSDANFPCAQKDNFQGYATGYFVAPFTGSIKFYLSSDDSSHMAITVNGTTQEFGTAIGEVSATYSGFVQGQYYPISVFFTEIGGIASWKLEYEYGSQARIVIPPTYLRSTIEYTLPTAGTNGLGGGGGAGTAGIFKLSGAKGGSGTAIIRYQTQSDTATASMITAIVNQESPSGLLTLNVPQFVTVGTYYETITVQDAANSAPYTAVVTIRINKATPTTTISLPGAVTTAKYGTPVTLSVAASAPGNINFKNSGTSISGCSMVGTVNGVATCSWTPSIVETASITALLSPTDSTNYNNSVETASAISVVVGRADTLTVTAGNITTTYSEDGSGNPNTTVASPTFTLSGLASIDSITAMSYAYSGPQNNGTNYASSPTAPKLAGTYSITPSAPVFTSPGTANNYSSVTFAPGTLTINRKGRGAWTATYGAGTNIITYGASKQETPTVAYPGDGTRSFTTTSSVCSVNASTGVITTLGVGACDVTAVLSQTANWLSDTLTATITINRGPRVATVTPARTTIRYGETTTVTSSVTQEIDSATVTFSAGSFLGCAVDNVTGEVTGIRAGASCAVSVTYGQTDLYESATASAAMTINRALAPVVTTETITAVAYTGNTAVVAPTYRVSGVLARDILQIVPTADVSNISLIDPTTYSRVASYRYFATVPTSYDSTTAPSLGGTYAVTPQTLTLLSGVDISNYETPTYVSSNLVINPIVQAALRILLSAQESVTVPYDITFAGGSSTGSINAVIVSGGSATGCSISALRLSTNSPGTCILRATKAADRNYLEVISDTATVTILNFVSNVDWNAIFNSGSGITITSVVPITVGPDTCSVDCVPVITDVQDASGNSTTTLTVGAPLRLIGVDLNTTDRILFTARINGARLSNVPADSFQIDSPTQITVMPPANFVPNTGENSSSISVRIIVFSSGGSINTEKIVIISL